MKNSNLFARKLGEIKNEKMKLVHTKVTCKVIQLRWKRTVLNAQEMVIMLLKPSSLIPVALYELIVFILLIKHLYIDACSAYTAYTDKQSNAYSAHPTLIH